MDAMSGGKISRRPRSRANSPHSERDPLRKNFRDWILRYIRSAEADCDERTDTAMAEIAELTIERARVQPGETVLEWRRRRSSIVTRARSHRR